MEKIDILAAGFAISTVIMACYIAYLKVGVNFLCETLAKHQVAMNELLEAMQNQVNINTKQGEINRIIYDELKINHNKLDDPSTGGVKQSN